MASDQAGAGGGSRKGRAAGSVTPQAGEIEGQAGEVGAEDFGRVEGFERGGLAFVPQADGDAGAGAAGAAAALVGAGAGDAAGFERGEAGAGLVDRDAAEAAVDDDADAIDGERGFGDGGGEDDLAAAGLGGADGAILLGWGELAVERGDIGIGGDAAGEAFGDAGDFALAGQEDEGGAVVFAQGGEDGCR